MMVYPRFGLFVAAALGVTVAADPGVLRAQQAAPAAPSLVFEGVTVVDVEHGKLVPNQRVVIAGNRIQSVADAGAGTLPPGAQVVEAGGKYLIPGLWDMHVHFSMGLDAPPAPDRDPFYSLLLAHGITGIRDAHSPVPLETMLQWRQEILAGTRVGPPRQLLTGSNTEIRLGSPELLTEEDVRALKARGANFFKLYPFTPAAAAAVKRAGLPFGGHLIQGWIPRPYSSAFEASDSGMTIFDHMVAAAELDSLCWGGRENASVDGCRPLAERMRKNGTWLLPNLLLYAYEDAPPTYMGPASLPVALRVKERLGAFWDGTPVSGNWLRDPAQSAASGQQPGTDARGFLHIMRQVGMPILAGTDADITPKGKVSLRTGGFALHGELALLVAEGLTPLEVLRSATLNPAKMLKGTDSLGTVAPGKLADLVLLDADPLADITNTVMIRAVVANGRYFNRAALDRMLADVRENSSEADVPEDSSDDEP